jgi:hypothetical protein
VAQRELNNLLNGSSLKDLVALPDSLEEERRRLSQDTETLVYENYKTFLQLAINISKVREFGGR